MIGVLIGRDVRRALGGAAWLPVGFFLVVATLLTITGALLASQAPTYDLILRGGRVEHARVVRLRIDRERQVTQLGR